jgi:S1-C subfamily serine protease
VARLGLQEGFVILGINGQTASSVEQLRDLFLNSRGRVTVEGLDANGNRVRFQYFTY